MTARSMYCRRSLIQPLLPCPARTRSHRQQPNEDSMRFERLVWYPHQHAVADRLLARPPGQPTSELARALLYAFWGPSFGAACLEGRTSKLEERRWLDAEPVWQTLQPPAGIVRLRTLAHQMMLKLPRLVGTIGDVRRQGEQCGGPETLDASNQSLAKHLLHHEDRTAETAVLHRVHILKTGSPVDHKIVSHSFHFTSIDEVEVAMLYWMCRLHITTLCLHIASTIGQESNDQSCSPRDPTTPAHFDISTLHAERTRLLTNIFMSWH